MCAHVYMKVSMCGKARWCCETRDINQDEADSHPHIDPSISSFHAGTLEPLYIQVCEHSGWKDAVS